MRKPATIRATIDWSQLVTPEKLEADRLENIRAAKRLRYRDEADDLFMEWQAMLVEQAPGADAAKGAWLAKRREIQTAVAEQAELATRSRS